MKPARINIKKTVIITFSVVTILVILVLVFLSPIAKRLIEKNDVKYLGREITLNRIYVNPFTGFVYISDLKIYEANSDSVFLSSDGLSANFDMFKMFSKTYEISDITLTRPVGKIIQNKKELNFSDIIERFSPKDKTSPKKPVHFNILNIKIANGTFFYSEKSIPINYFIKGVNIESSGKLWDVDSIPFKFAFASGIGQGDAKGDAAIDINSLNYRFSIILKKYDLSTFEQYVKEISNYASLSANMDANIKASGNIKNTQSINAKGLISINDLHFGKNKKEDYLAFKKFTLSIKHLNPENKKYLFDSVAFMHPYFKYERYDYLDNLQNMFGKNGKKVKEAKATSGSTNILFQIADYVKEIAKNFFKSDYKLGRLAIYKADLRYEDYTLNEKFEAAADPLYLTADSIERSDNWVNFRLRTNIKPYGNVSVDLNINPKDSTDFNIQYHLKQLPAAMFNPFLITYTSFPLDRGTVEIKGQWRVTNATIKSNNHLVIIDPRLSNKQKKDGAKWIPLKLIMFFARERGNVIDYEIPITGNLKNPKFKYKDVILDALKNLFLKPVTSPYIYEVKHIETTLEKSFALKWEMQKNSLQPNQQKFIEKMIEYLKEHPDVHIRVTSIPYLEKEKEYIMFFEAKKLYYMSINNLSSRSLVKDDTIAIDRLQIKDSLFISYLNKHVGNRNTVQEKCEALVGTKKINSLYNELISNRKKTFLSYFAIENIGEKITFRPTAHKVPYNGFSLYKMDYKDEWPEELQEAYAKLEDLNNERPRDKFKRERENNRKFLRKK